MANSVSLKAQRSTYPENTRLGSYLLGGCCFVTFLVWICPGIYWRDAGELTASAYGLGVAHPTGFPLWIIVAKLASFIPLGSIGFRVNCVSALLGGVAVGLAYPLFLRFIASNDTTSRAAAAASALLLGLGQTFWLHSTTAEVYIPNLLAVIVLLHLVLNDTPVSMRVAAVVTGLGAGLHSVFVVVSAVVWFTVLVHWWKTHPERIRRHAPILIALAAVAAVTVLAYLPIRASQSPWRNWGNPSTFTALIDHLTGARIRGAFSEKMGVGSHFDIDLETALIQLFEQVSWGGVVALLGSFVLLRRHFYHAFLLASVGLADLLFTVLLNPMGMLDRQTGLVTTLAVVSLSAVGFSALGRVIKKGFRARGAGLLTFVAAFGLVTPAVFSGGAMRNTRNLYQPTDVGDLPFDYAPPSTLLMVTSDNVASAATYLQGVENRRPDVTTIVKQHIADNDYINSLHKHHGDTHLTAKFREFIKRGESPQSLVSSLVDENKDRRPIYWEIGDPVLDRLVADELRIYPLISRLYGEPPGDVQGVLFSLRSRWRVLANGRWPGAALVELSHIFSLMGSHMVLNGDKQGGYAVISEAFATSRTDAAVVNNFAHGLLYLGQNEQAEKAYERVVKLRPGYALGWYNLGTSRYNNEDLVGSADAFQKAVKLGASDSQVAKMAFYMAILHARTGELALAHALMSAALPSLPDLMKAQGRRALDDLRSQLSESP